MEENNENTSQKNDTKGIKLGTVVGICVIVAVVILAVIFGLRKVRTEEPVITENGDGDGEIEVDFDKEGLKDLISTFEIQFNSYPLDTSVKYDFENETKTIIHYTSAAWDSEEEEVEYDRFDELFDYLYTTVFPNEDYLKYSSLFNFGVSYAMPEPYYDMYVHFNSMDQIPTMSSNWFSYNNTKTGYAGWGLNGYKLPSYWKELLKILEIDKSIFSDGTNYNFYNSGY